jgi:hypothetical protein
MNQICSLPIRRNEGGVFSKKIVRKKYYLLEKNRGKAKFKEVCFASMKLLPTSLAVNFGLNGITIIMMG